MDGNLRSRKVRPLDTTLSFELRSTFKLLKKPKKHSALFSRMRFCYFTDNATLSLTFSPTPKNVLEGIMVTIDVRHVRILAEI